MIHSKTTGLLPTLNRFMLPTICQSQYGQTISTEVSHTWEGIRFLEDMTKITMSFHALN